MSIDITHILAALLLGLAGAGHCLGMCGGIAVALRTAEGASRSLPVAYHVGRVLSYALLGGLLGSAAGAIELAGSTIFLRFLAGALLVAMGLHTLNVWWGIQHIERLGAGLWRHIEPLAQRSLPPKRLHQALLVGGVWGFMPCGLIYSALTWSAAAGSGAIDSAVLMTCFGLGTLPAMLGATLLGQRLTQLIRHPIARKALGSSLVIAGVWTLWLTTSHLDHLLGQQPHHHPDHTHGSAPASNADSDARYQAQ